MSTTSASEWIIGPGDVKFFTKRWSPAQGTPAVASVIFVHGFIEHIERYDHVFPKFAEQGIQVFAFDQRGFGQTAQKTKTQGRTSWPEQLGDISFFVSHAYSYTPSLPLYLFGHSMGGGLSLAYATRKPPSKDLDKIKGVVASSPLLRQSPGVKTSLLIVRAGSVLGKISSTLRIKAEVKAEHVTRDAEIGKAYAVDPLCPQVGTFRGVADMLLGGESLMTDGYKRWPEGLPLLVVHGTGDLVTDAKASEAFVASVKGLEGGRDAEYIPFEGFYHEMHNEPGDDKWKEIDAIAKWIKSKL
ncbi:hypothetical protein MNV49_007578 [Pseudohyphozyma bogoriensis]|nr:hypothetical protein MNV49_007578 [Pseudohyphozyma bogoriensis]